MTTPVSYELEELQDWFATVIENPQVAHSVSTAVEAWVATQTALTQRPELTKITLVDREMARNGARTSEYCVSVVTEGSRIGLEVILLKRLINPGKSGTPFLTYTVDGKVVQAPVVYF